MRYLLILTTCLTLTGCFGLKSGHENAPLAGPLFCDVESPRRFTQEEINWRAENAPWNLRRDYATNGTWDAECKEKNER